LKHFLLTVFGFSMAVTLTGTLVASNFAWMILGAIGPWIVRLAIIVVSVMGAAIVMESVRH